MVVRDVQKRGATYNFHGRVIDKECVIDYFFCLVDIQDQVVHPVPVL